jgi:hypothetical protein
MNTPARPPSIVLMWGSASWWSFAAPGMGAFVAGCAVLPRPLDVPRGDDAAVIVASVGLGEAMNEVARHSWIAARERGQARFTRYEIGGGGETDDPFESPCRCTGEDRHASVMVHAVVRGDDAERAIVCIKREDARYHEGYGFWPGPNCNTYVERMARLCGISMTLPATAYGRDYRGLVGATTTSEGTGVQLDSPLIGAKLGLAEGVEVHVLTLPFGIDFWPPAIIVPIGGGRLGFADR